ncbi:MAG: hypothetical protein KAJ46_03765 [Sedimentisphaerales bacterium]|nr:hypothetical protein [Sedimentisphaerales bacterium]
MCFFADERSLLRSGRFWIGSLCGVILVFGVGLTMMIEQKIHEPELLIVPE